MDTQDREFLTDLGVSEANIDGLDLFQQVQRPESMDDFHDDTVCEPVTFTAGQVATLRGALRAQVQNMANAMNMAAAGLWDGPEGGWDPEVEQVLSIENLLAEAWAACKSQDVTVPDYFEEFPV